MTIIFAHIRVRVNSQLINIIYIMNIEHAWRIVKTKLHQMRMLKSKVSEYFFDVRSSIVYGTIESAENTMRSVIWVLKF